MGTTAETATLTADERQTLDTIELIFQEGNPSGIKNSSYHLSLCSSTVRFLLVPASSYLCKAVLKEKAILTEILS